MARIYTRSGDKGTTSLIGGERVAKDDLRVEAYGTVDELGAHIALLTDWAAAAGHTDTVAFLDGVATRLMKIEALLAVGAGFTGQLSQITEADVAELEAEIDRLSEGLPQLNCFTIPRGAPLVSQCHICRTVCRRAERRIHSASAHYPTSEVAVCYINRLSDYLYALGRNSSKRLGVEEKSWLG